MSKKTETIQIEGMSCGGCVRQVQEALEATEGIETQNVEIGSARVSYDPARTDCRTIEQAIAQAGFKALSPA